MTLPRGIRFRRMIFQYIPLCFVMPKGDNRRDVRSFGSRLGRIVIVAILKVIVDISPLNFQIVRICFGFFLAWYLVHSSSFFLFEGGVNKWSIQCMEHPKMQRPAPFWLKASKGSVQDIFAWGDVHESPRREEHFPGG